MCDKPKLLVVDDESVICLPSPEGDDSFYETLAQLRQDGTQVDWRGDGTIRWPDTFELALDMVPREEDRGPASGST